MEGNMKAVVLHAPNVYQVEEVEIPKPGRNEVLVEIKSIAICGSDPGIFGGKVLGDGWPPHYPFIAGHEFAGKVVELGEGASNLKVGDRVAGEAHCGCGTCEMCKKGFYNLCDNYGHSGHHHYGHATPGCYAQYQVYDEKALTLMPENVSYDEGSMVDTAGIAFNGIQLTGIVPGGWVGVIGPGPMGLLLAQMAKTMGAKTIIIGYQDHDRLEMAKTVGVDHVIETTEVTDVVEEVRRITGGHGTDRTFDCAGAGDTLDEAIRMTAKNGKVGVIAYPKVPTTQKALYYMVKNQITVQGVRANPNCSLPVLGLIGHGKLEAGRLITHTFPLEQTAEAFDTFVNHKDGAVKVVIHPNGDEED
ncbi:MAG: zinc-dependent alcohol dehydrogenase [Agathobaculum sp.]|jgi:L-iditol 2-dehydrogenase|uniref:zinc-dependent alcohol dehydrogenase n=1 Tax=Agathobaculum sp. TaxID=2048138 RepID=UPI003D914C51